MNKKLQKGITTTMAAAMAMGIAMPATTVLAAATTNGWSMVQGQWYFYNNGTTVKNAWKQDSSAKWFYLGANGAMVKNTWEQDSKKKWFYLGADGAMVTNYWAQDGSKRWFYLGTDGEMKINYWDHWKDGKQYYLGIDGAMLVSTVTPDGWTVGSNGAWDGQPSVAQKAAAVKIAIAAVVKAEGSKLQADISSAITLVNALPADVSPDTTKAGLQNRLETLIGLVISNVSLKSNNVDPNIARVGDKVTLTFTTTQEVFKLGNFKINGSNPTSFICTGSGTSWTTVATYVLEDSDPEGKVNFQINVKNVAGIYSLTTEETTDASLVTVTKSPEISAVNIVSNNADTKMAKVGDTVKLTFTTKEMVTKLSNFKINGGNPSSFSCNGIGSNWITVATYVVDGSDPEGKVNFQINVKDAAGFNSITTEATTDGSFVSVVWSAAVKLQVATDTVVKAEASKLQADVVSAKVMVDALPGDVSPDVTKSALLARLADITAPIISNVKLASNNLDKTKATDGDIVTLTFTSDQAVTKLASFKINGSNPDTFTNVGNIYTVTHLVDGGDTTGAATFQINVQNAKSVYSTTVENTTDLSAVIINHDLVMATAAVVKAETSKLQLDVLAAKTLVDALPIDVAPSTIKSDLQKRVSDITAPVIGNVSFKSVTNADNDGNATTATIGDTITLTFTADKPVSKLGSFKINGSNPDTFTSASNIYFVSHIVDAGDATGAATFQINVKSVGGIYSATTEATTDGSLIVIH